MNDKVNILFIGDIVGITGLELTIRLLKTFQERYKIDFTIANVENVTDGKSISEQDANTLFHYGVDVMTGGNHLWDKMQIKQLLAKEKRLLRPMNYPRENVGYGFLVTEPKKDKKIAVLSLQGRIFMHPIDCPFKVADWVLGKIGDETKIVIIDIHAEATAEKLALAYYLDGRVSAVLGTHTHVQTADARILPKGTAFISDVGMTGPYDSVVGMKKEIAIKRFVSQTPFKYEVASDDAKLCAVFVSIDPLTGKAVKIEPIIFPEFTNTL
jgi:2',3'-cyclic-nucleotide 2'-phosphodiesterase